MLTPDDFVRREVHYCVSSLVSTLAQTTNYAVGKRNDPNGEANAAHYDLCCAAQELCSPIDDWEEAAIQAGWSQGAPGALWTIKDGREENFTAETAEEACEIDDLEPYQREVFEHWIVSDWLADRLAEKGEKVDKDFAGLTVWARTTTDQGIASDSVIEAICADINNA